jgi:hypothetical protein
VAATLLPSGFIGFGVCETSTLGGGGEARRCEMRPFSNITIAGCWIAAMRAASAGFCPSQ